MPHDPSLSLFTAALGLASPWQVLSIDFDESAKRIDFQVGYDRGTHFSCPACEASDQPVHDRRERTWQHLHFFEHRAYIHADVPRVRCAACGKTSQVRVPWARPGSGFTQLFEAMLVTLATHMPANTVARMFGIGDDAVWRILHHYTYAARAREDFSSVTAVGIDETAARRGHDYITIFHDLKARRILYACPGREQSTVDRFVEDLRAHGGDPERIDAVCIDMSKAYIAGVTRALPDAAITFDAFHVIQLANHAVDQVRRREASWAKSQKRSRWIWLKDHRDLTARQARQFQSLSRENLETGRAWRLKEALRALYAEAPSRDQAEARLTRWVSWARRCRLEPFKKLAATIKAHWDGVLNAFDSRLTNGSVEGMNGLIQAAKARARGYRTSRTLITMSYLIGSKLAAHPANPYATTSCVQAARG